MLQVSEYMLSTTEHGVLCREPSRQAAEAAALNSTGALDWEAQAYGPALRELLDERHARRAYTAY